MSPLKDLIWLIDQTPFGVNVGRRSSDAADSGRN